MKASLCRWCLVIILIYFMMPIYATVQGYMARLIVPIRIAFSATSKTSLITIIILTSSFGAFISALITAFPCGYLARKQPVIIAILLVISAFYIPAYVRFEDKQGLSTFNIVVLTIEFVALVISCLLFTVLGYLFAEKKHKSAV